MSKNFLDVALERAIQTLQQPNAWRQLACAFAGDDPYHATIDGDDTDGFCIHGAIAKAAMSMTSSADDAAAFERRVMDRIKSAMGWESDHDVHAFNDAEHRTLPEVINMLKSVLTHEPVTA